MHAELPQPHTEQQSGVARIARHLAAHPDGDILVRASLYGVVNQPQDRRVQRVVKVVHLVVDPIDRQRVLDEIVGAD